MILSSICSGNKRVVELLINSSADVNFNSNDTALIWAAKNGNVQIETYKCALYKHEY